MIAYAGGVNPLLLAVLPLFMLACTRITILICYDELTGTPRRWLIERLVRVQGDESLLAYLVTCAWCASFTLVGLPLSALWYFHGLDWWVMIPVTGFAMSQVTGMTHKIGR
jgi:hypothetical protein